MEGEELSSEKLLQDLPPELMYQVLDNLIPSDDIIEEKKLSEQAYSKKLVSAIQDDVIPFLRTAKKQAALSSLVTSIIKSKNTEKHITDALNLAISQKKLWPARLFMESGADLVSAFRVNIALENEFTHELFMEFVREVEKREEEERARLLTAFLEDSFHHNNAKAERELLTVISRFSDDPEFVHAIFTSSDKATGNTLFMRSLRWGQPNDVAWSILNIIEEYPDIAREVLEAKNKLGDIPLMALIKKPEPGTDLKLVQEIETRRRKGENVKALEEKRSRSRKLALEEMESLIFDVIDIGERVGSNQLEITDKEGDTPLVLIRKKIEGEEQRKSAWKAMGDRMLRSFTGGNY